jgi:hypothetical protein
MLFIYHLDPDGVQVLRADQQINIKSCIKEAFTCSGILGVKGEGLVLDYEFLV